MTTVVDELERLYEADFYAWTRAQARALCQLARTRPNAPVDWKHLVEEVEDLGRSELHAVTSQLRRLLIHLLKLACSPARDPRPLWRASVQDARSEIEERLTPTLRRALSARLPRIYAAARRIAREELAAHDEHEAAARLPERCPWTLAQLLDPDFWPDDPGDPHRRDFRRRRPPC